MQRFIEAVRNLATVAGRKGAFDGDRRVLNAIATLSLEVEFADSVDDVLRKTVKEVARRIGAPGDWGYGHPEGDAVAELYNAWNAVLEAAAA